MPNPKEKTIHQLKQVNGQLAQLFEYLQEYNETALAHAPSASAWNSLQIVKHLSAIESTSLASIKYKLESGKKYKRAGIKEKYNAWMLRRITKSPVKAKAPDVEGFSPSPNGLEIKSLKDEMLTHRKEMYEFLKGRSDEAFELAIWKHPVFGRMSIYQMLQFFEVHTDSHKKQIKRNLSHYFDVKDA